MGFRMAVVQPMSHRPPDDERNVADAVAHVEDAAGRGAAIVVFPETYPGPWRTPASFDPTEAMADAARRCKTYVVYGTIEPVAGSARAAYNLIVLARPDGGEPGRYRRTLPPGPWIYDAGDPWDFVYVAGDDYPVFDTPLGRIGFGMCSEVYMPEVSRALALRGAEMIILPAGSDKRKLWATWRNLIWARATENLAAVVTTQNIFGTEKGLAMVALPEEIILESSRAGVFLVDLDLDRVRELRSGRDAAGSSLEFGAKCGVLSQWQRPEMYDRFLPRS